MQCAGVGIDAISDAAMTKTDVVDSLLMSLSCLKLCQGRISVRNRQSWSGCVVCMAGRCWEVFAGLSEGLWI